MRRLPIRVRITLAFAGAMAVLLAGLGAFIYLRFQSQLYAIVDQGLRSRAAEVTALAGRGSDRPLNRAPPGVLADHEETFAQILTPSGAISDTTRQFGERPVLDPADVRRASAATITVVRRVPGVEGDVRLLAKPVSVGGRRLVVVVGASIDDRQEALKNLLTLLLIGGPVALLLASLAGYGAATAALRPVEAMRKRAAEISADDADQRLPLPPSDDELRRLGETLNGMLGRLEAAIERERAFVDDASHELRTPLALHKTELELAMRYADEPEELRASIVSAIEEVDRLIGLAEDMLVVARSPNGELATDLEPIEPVRLLEAVQDRFAARAAEAGRAVLIGEAASGSIEVDRVRVEQALTNLVDNALRYGEGDVTLAARRRAESVELHVTDAGAGFPVEFVGRAFERFTRADAARSDGGSGLGLAIVATIARAHGGSVGARNLDPGADVWIELPRRSPELSSEAARHASES